MGAAAGQAGSFRRTFDSGVSGKLEVGSEK